MEDVKEKYFKAKDENLENRGGKQTGTISFFYQTSSFGRLHHFPLFWSILRSFLGVLSQLLIYKVSSPVPRALLPPLYELSRTSPF